jgi:triosephosphate isomerase
LLIAREERLLNPSRKPLIAGNWKMFHGDGSGAILAAECVTLARATIGVELVIAPPYTALAACAAECHESPLALAAQNVHPGDRGACTGEIDSVTLKNTGCTWVIIGHSERRHILAENDELIAEKVGAALETVIFPPPSGRSDYAASAATCAFNSNSIGLT